MTAGLPPVWPVEFDPGTRVLIIARDTPLGCANPLCWVCAAPIDKRYVEIHHRQYKSRGGRGNPANGISLHRPMTVPTCHVPRIHNNEHGDGEPDAALLGWSVSRHAHPAALYEPVWHAARGWVTLDDDACWSPVPAGPELDRLTGILGSLKRPRPGAHTWAAEPLRP